MKQGWIAGNKPNPDAWRVVVNEQDGVGGGDDVEKIALILLVWFRVIFWFAVIEEVVRWLT